MPSAIQAHRSSDETLIRRATGGDLEAYNQLVLNYQDMVYRHAFALLGDRETAEDAAQESFIKAFEHLAYFQGGSFRAWLLKIATNSAYDALRQSRRHPTQPLFLQDHDGEEIESGPWLADPGASVEATIEQNELAREIYRVMDDLPDSFRSILTLIDLYELDYREAAQALMIPMGTVKSRLARARLLMRKSLKTVLDFRSDLMSLDTSVAA